MGKKIEKYPIDKNFEKHMHDGHRSRLLKTVNDVGIEFLSSIQKLEFVLFYIFPRGDVNPLAHILLERFENFHNVMEASVQDLMRVKGIGETAAMKLHALLSIYDEYNLDKYNNNYTVDQIDAFYELVELLLRHKNQEYFYIFGISPSGVIGNPRGYGRGDAQKVLFDATDVTNYLATFKVNQLIFVHNHPNGDCHPSRSDEQSFIRLNNMLAYMGIRVYDSYIIGRDGIYSWSGQRYVRHFTKSHFEVGCKENTPKKMIASQK